MSLKRLFHACALIGAGVNTSASAEFSLAFPLDCTLGVDCYIQNYVDHDQGPGFRDFACGRLGYDGHKGTDIAIANDVEMASGVTVRAAADGIVQGVRDGMVDQRSGPPGSDPAISGRECGNGVLIRHEDGWETQYCHLRRGSVRAQPGDIIAAGDVLGEIGLSGQTQFPHLHISVRKDGEVVDPFQPDSQASCDATTRSPIWSEDLPYQRTGWIDAGFTNSVPDYESVKTGAVSARPPRPNEPMVLWAFAFGAEPHTRVRLEIFGPDGTRVMHQDMMLTRHQAQFFRAAGHRAPAEGWQSGRYRGHYLLLAPDGEIIDEGWRDVDIR